MNKVRTVSYKEMLQAYKAAIDADIAVYTEHTKQTTRDHYGNYAGDVTDVFFDVLNRGGKRIRGALAMVGYEMCGGRDEQMIVRAATALEMVNAYILMVDDIQDRSKLRRGKATAHEILATYHREHHLKGDAVHSGISLALNAALAGAHAAQMLLAGLQVSPELRLKAVGIVNHAMLVTSHGQNTDIMHELMGTASAEDIDHVLEWKTAYYTVLDPLCVGMVLADACCDDTDAIREYALPMGKAFQITDDIIGVFGDDAETGKSAMDDIRQGKQTILTTYAANHLPKDDATFLYNMLGNDRLTKTEFEHCKQLLTTCGARDYAQQAARRYIEQSVAALDTHGDRWSTRHVTFLKQLAESLQQRTK